MAGPVSLGSFQATPSTWSPAQDCLRLSMNVLPWANPEKGNSLGTQPMGPFLHAQQTFIENLLGARPSYRWSH